MEPKRTALYDEHIKAGGKMVEFAGFMMPIQYTGIKVEHDSVRNSCGIFDVSHMGEVRVSGTNAEKTVQRFTTNDILDMVPGQVKYSPMCNAHGGVVDDLLVYKMAEGEYILVINAANIKKDLIHMLSNNLGSEISDISDDLSQIAIQGPKSEAILGKMIDELPEKYYTFIKTSYQNSEIIISRTGYTGEDGFEIYCPNAIVATIWQDILKTGGSDVMPCGLGCRDTLRFEASMPLYGHEMTEEISPIEAGLKYFVKTEDDNDFIGKEVIKKQIEEGITRRRCGIEILDRGIARQGAEVFFGDKKVGFVTSGTKSLTLDNVIAMALVDLPYNKIGTELKVEVRDKMLDAVVVKMPFYKKS